MNPIVSIVFKWYLFLTIFAILSSTTLKFTSLLSGVVLMWLIYLVFFVGFKFGGLVSTKTKIYYLKPDIYNDNIKGLPLPVISFFSIIASLYASYFYTGQSFINVVTKLMTNISLYNEYQTYFAQQSLRELTLAKAPAILSMLYLKFSVIYSFIHVIIIKRKLIAYDFIWLSVIFLSFLFFSIARGTSFEFFELLLLLWFCFSTRVFVHAQKQPLFSTSRLFLVLIGLAALLFYSFHISARYSFGEVAKCATNTLCLDNQSFLYYISPPLAELTFKLSAYFTFGIYYTSTLIDYFWFNNFTNFFMLLFPFASLYDAGLESRFLCGVMLDCGVAWVPDISNYILKYGFLFILSFVFVLGVFVRRLLLSAFLSGSFLKFGILYFVFLGLVSLPVGNFVTVSSSNWILFVLLVIWFLFKGFYIGSVAKSKVIFRF